MKDDSAKKFLVVSFFIVIFSSIFCLFSIVFANFQNIMKKNLNLRSNFKYVVKSSIEEEILHNDKLKRLSLKVADLTGKSVGKGIFLKGDTLLKMPKLPRNSDSDCFIAEMQKFCDKFPAKVYLLLVPTKFQINGGFIDVNYFSSYEQEFIQKIYSSLDPYLINLNSNIFSVYSKNLDFFYRTDSRINSFGNYLVYRSILKQMGGFPFSVDNFETETCCDDFYGNLFSEKFVDVVRPDVIELFTLSKTTYTYYYNFLFKRGLQKEVTQIYSDSNCLVRNSIFDLNQLNSNDRTKVFFGGVAPIKILKNFDFSGENLLVFSDGSADGLIQFLAFHFNRIIVVDLNQFNTTKSDLHTILNEIKSLNIDKVLFLYDVESLDKSANFKNLEYFY